MATQTVEQFLVEQLEKIAPGKYTIASVLQLFKSKLRFPCTHLKGGRFHRATTIGKDYNLSIFTFPTGVTEIKCLYNCGLKVRSDDKDLRRHFAELLGLPTSNSSAKAESLGKLNPGTAPVYTDEYRKRIRESSDTFWKAIQEGVANGRIKSDDPILGGTLPHPQPIEAPDSIVERGIKLAHLTGNNKYKILKSPLVVVQDSIPALEEPKAGPEPVKSNKKIRKARKTQSRRKRGG